MLGAIAAHAVVNTTPVVSVSYVGAGAATDMNADFGETAAVAVPAGVVAGDLLVALATCRTNSAPSPPAGWTEVVHSLGNPRARVVVRTAGASEPASHDFTSFAPSEVVMVAYQGLAASPVRVAAVEGPATTSYIRFPSVAAVSGDLLVGLGYTVSDPGTVSPPVGWTERVEVGVGNPRLYVADLYPSAGGATGNNDADTQFSPNNVGVTVALIPA